MAKKRGRPPKKPEDRLDAQVGVHLRPELKERLQRHAAMAGGTISTYIRDYLEEQFPPYPDGAEFPPLPPPEEVE
jgi:predicted HicB family RNase H-like nuclease